MLRTHDPLVVERHVVEHVVDVHVLQVARADQVVVGHACDGEDRRLLDAGVQHAVEQMRGARAAGGEADAELAGERGVPDRRHRGDLLVSDMDVADLVLPLAQRVHQAVDAVPGQAEDGVHAPLDEAATKTSDAVVESATGEGQRADCDRSAAFGIVAARVNGKGRCAPGRGDRGDDGRRVPGSRVG
nr:hypothetical protein [Ornithinicoccus soli]